MRHETLIAVGCGDHYHTNVAESLAAMEAASEITLVATVDRRPRASAGTSTGSTHPSAASDISAAHILREPGQSLLACMEPWRDRDPVVFLAHAHEAHASDARELVEAGVRVIVEKPYAIRAEDLAVVRELARAYPHRIVLVESYIMMRAAPLLHAAGLLVTDSRYTRGPGCLEALARRTLQDTRGMLASIGRPRMVLTDLLEGQGDRGRFEHRGLQYADSRVGIGVILDMALHSVAPLYALESLLGALPAADDVRLGAAACDRFVRYAGIAHGVPARFVPETYAELALTTATGVPIVVCVGKYVLPQAIQRRLLIIGDEGSACLNLTSCTLSLGLREEDPRPVLRLPNEGPFRYWAVLRACLDLLAGVSPYAFDPADVALRANELCLELTRRANDGAESRPTYVEGASPGAILIGERRGS